MTNIRTYNDLQEEKKRLEALLIIQKDVIRLDLITLREEFRPALSLMSAIGKMANLNKNNPLLGTAINLAGEMLLGNVLLSRSTKVTRVVVPFLAKKVSSYFFKNGGSIFQKFAGLWKKYSSNGSEVL